MATIRKVVQAKNGKTMRVDPEKDQRPAIRWYAQVFVGRHATTQRPQFVSKTFRRKSEADAWARGQESLKDQGTRPATTRETLAQYLQRWLPVYAGQVRTSTSYNVRKTLERWIIRPRNGARPIGGKQLRKPTDWDFDRLYLYLAAQGMAPRGIRYLHGLLKQALKAAVKKGDLPRNPAEFATLPKANHAAEIVDDDDEDPERVGALDRAQADRFLKAAREEDWHTALWYVLLTTGLRPGEALALKWRHVDMEKREVKVRATLTRIGVRGWKLTKPKTEKSRRTVPLPDVTVRELRRWKAQQSLERLAAGPMWRDHGFVFTNRHGGPLNLSNLARRCFRRVMERAGLGGYGPEVPDKPRGQPGPKRRRLFIPSHRMYALRHTFASLLLADGVPLWLVSQLMGHTNITTTANNYAWSLPKERQEATGRFDRMFATA